MTAGPLRRVAAVRMDWTERGQCPVARAVARTTGRLVGPRDDVRHLQGSARGGDRAQQVERHGTAGTYGGNLRIVLQRRRVEQEPEQERRHADPEHSLPRRGALAASGLSLRAVSVGGALSGIFRTGSR